MEITVEGWQMMASAAVVGGLLWTISKDQSAKRAKLYDQLDSVKKELTTNSARLDSMDDRLDRIEQRMDRHWNGN